MSDVTLTTTTPPVIVLCSDALITNLTVTIAPTSVGLLATLGQHSAVLLPPLIPRDTMRGVVGLATVPQQHPQSQILLKLMKVMP